jgi:hypothetical protein
MACADDVKARAKATAINLIISFLLGFDSDRKAGSRSLRAIHSTASRPVDPPQLHRLFGSRAACSDAMSTTILRAEGCTRPGALPEMGDTMGAKSLPRAIIVAARFVACHQDFTGKWLRVFP